MNSDSDNQNQLQILLSTSSMEKAITSHEEKRLSNSIMEANVK